MKRLLLLTISVIIFIMNFNTMLFSQKGGRWQFENNGDDTAPWDTIENPGELQGGASYATENLIEGTSYLWQPNQSYFDFFKVEDSEDLDFDNVNIGISAWIYPIGNPDVYWIVVKGDQYTSPRTMNYAIRLSGYNNLEFLIRDLNDAGRKVTSTFTVPTNQWTFVAVYYDFEEGKLYMWDEQKSSPTDTIDFEQDYFSNDDPLAIGCWYTSSPTMPAYRNFIGGIDDVRIGSEIDQIIGEYSGVKISENTLTSREFRLLHNYPNPFNAQTIISFEIPREEHVRVTIFDQLGRKVITLVDKSFQRGFHSIPFDMNDYASGIYYYRLDCASFRDVHKMILLK